MLQGAVQVRATIGVVTKIKVIVIVRKNMQKVRIPPNLVIGEEQEEPIHQRAQKVAVPIAAELRVQIGRQVVVVGLIWILPAVQERAVNPTGNMLLAVKIYIIQI